MTGKRVFPAVAATIAAFRVLSSLCPWQTLARLISLLI